MNGRHFTVMFNDLDAGTEALLARRHQISTSRTMTASVGRPCPMRVMLTVQPGAMLLAGNESAKAVVRVVGVDDDGQIHFSILPGFVAKHRHLLDATSA